MPFLGLAGNPMGGGCTWFDHLYSKLENSTLASENFWLIYFLWLKKGGGDFCLFANLIPNTEERTFPRNFLVKNVNSEFPSWRSG